MIYPFSPYRHQDENNVVRELLDYLDWPDTTAKRVQDRAETLITTVRSQKGRGGQLEVFLQEFSLNTEEGLAMMCLAEALLRVPDAQTANLLIKDKVAAANWLQKQGVGEKDWMTKAAGIGMALTRKTLDSALSRLGAPIIREAMVKAMQMMGRQFVLGTSIDDALGNATMWEEKGCRMSYDMLGEGARDAKTADFYFDTYSNSIDKIAQKNEKTDQNEHVFSKKAGISVKLSALHPRYDYAQHERCVPEITEKLHALCEKAAQHDMALTVDAEEANRLDLSIAIINNILESDVCATWHGFGVAVQAYQRRALPLIDYLSTRTADLGRHIQVRLVKGAYWDSEIKHAQMHGYESYPVFTRKMNTDLSYLACAQALMAVSDRIYPMFATHNAHTIAAIQDMAAASHTAFEFQRLHGMGETLYAALMDQNDVRVSVYAPVGPHKDLLPYLVRRLLENGANSSFVNQLLDHDMDAADIAADPVQKIRGLDSYTHEKIPQPRELFGQKRSNSKGIDLDDPSVSSDIEQFIRKYTFRGKPCSMIEGKKFEDIDEDMIPRVFGRAQAAFYDWNTRDVAERVAIINKCAQVMELCRDELMAILVHEAGKNITDARDEVREAIDFCRYYAAQALTMFDPSGSLMPGYTGEENRLTWQGRGVFVCISPWNFPLAIFTGQVVATLVSGNTVIAKPASQTRYIAMRVVEIMHQSGVPHDVLHLLCGNGVYGSKILEQNSVAGAVFTGSTATAKHIQKTLVDNNDAIIPFIAETGGQNAMIVDSSALIEQVVDDVVQSAFGSAGQRCSALRVLYVQKDIADRVIDLLRGAMAEIRVGDPQFLSTDIGHIIDQNARNALVAHCENLEGSAEKLAEATMCEGLTNKSQFFNPVIYEIDDISILKDEVFGPILHIIRYDADDIDDIVHEINNMGYGLTFGIHSRITSRYQDIAQKINAGNVYVNRNMTGAIVGVQPFGGMGLSGTGPKAGGPHYLHAFAVEKVVTTDTTAFGGNASLVSLGDV